MLNNWSGRTSEADSINFLSGNESVNNGLRGHAKLKQKVKIRLSKVSSCGEKPDCRQNHFIIYSVFIKILNLKRTSI